jgi:hypothetical protein
MAKAKRQVKVQNIRVFKEVYDKAKAVERILQNKDKAFGLVHSMKKVFSKGQQITVSKIERHFKPFWHISAENYQEYKRATNYSFPVKSEVISVKINGKSIEVSDKMSCDFSGMDHCVEHYEKEVITDATGNKEKHLEKYLEFESTSIKETEDLMGKNQVVIPATVRASYIVKELLKELIKPIHADEVIEDKVQVTKMVLYFRPFYSIELTNQISGKTGVLEINALTGEIKKGRLFNQELKELITENALFDLGAELASTIIPGAAFGAIIGREVKNRYGRKKELKKMHESKQAYRNNSNNKK